MEEEMAIELPKDAKGREIPLDTVALYDEDGNVYSIRRFIYTNDFDLNDKWMNSWYVVADDYKTAKSEQMYLTPPDTWEKLEEDLGRAAKHDAVTAQCRYFNTTYGCVNCPIHNGDGGCTHKDERAFGDILNRIRKLRGEDR